MMRRFFYIRDFLIQKNISIYTKVIKLLKIEIEKMTSNLASVLRKWINLNILWDKVIFLQALFEI